MKGIYKFFNDVQLDNKEFTELDVSEFEKAQVKKRLKQSLKKKKKRVRWSQIAVAMLFIGLSGAILGYTFPANAGSIPIVRNIFQFIDGERSSLYENYKEFSTAIELSDVSKGVEISINDALYDGETIFVTYSLKSKKKLGDHPRIHDTSSSVKDADGMAWGSEIKRVDDYNYVGMLTVGNFGTNVGDTAYLVWDIDKILTEENTMINGHWRFAFSVEATTKHTQIVNKSSTLDDIKVSVKKITHTPMSTIVYVRQQLDQHILDYWNNIELDFTMTDDKGNSYDGLSHGGRGYPHDLSIGKTFGKVDERATTLKIMPHIRLIKSSVNEDEQIEEKNAFGETVVRNSPVEIEDYKEINLEPIVIELKE
ncbi:DUF4179 domain-containing protein [Lysinibacillus sp. NPDC047702]|uniref:DUF4179 domain-containing protein n=1 Tax=unclassified Lysinibacillus TaxID=2636778 RepID=UPI003CFBFC34